MSQTTPPEFDVQAEILALRARVTALEEREPRSMTAPEECGVCDHSLPKWHRAETGCAFSTVDGECDCRVVFTG